MMSGETTSISAADIPEAVPLRRAIFLYLVPGLIITASFAILSPVLNRHWGVDPFLCFTAALVPWAVYTIRHILRHGVVGNRFALERLTRYAAPLPGWKTIPLVLGCVVGMLALFTASNAVLAPFHRLFKDRLPVWHFDALSYSRAIAEGSLLQGYSTVQLVAVFFALNGIIGIIAPLIEELYFTGYLFSRTERTFGRLHLLAHSFFFALYHWFTIWLLPARLLSIWPMFLVAKKYRSLYLTMLIHCSVNLLGSLGLTIEIARVLAGRLR